MVRYIRKSRYLLQAYLRSLLIVLILHTYSTSIIQLAQRRKSQQHKHSLTVRRWFGRTIITSRGAQSFYQRLFIFTIMHSIFILTFTTLSSLLFTTPNTFIIPSLYFTSLSIPSLSSFHLHTTQTFVQVSPVSDAVSACTADLRRLISFA